jgi:hypothetical protein
MRKTIETKSVFKKEILICDTCGKTTDRPDFLRLRKCPICGKHVCTNCAVLHDLWTRDWLIPTFSSDYPDYICKICWETGKDLRQQMHDLEKETDDKLEKLYLDWKKLIKELEVKNDRIGS